MDTTRWKHGDEFAVVDLVASFQFRSPSSLSFLLGTKGDALKTLGMKEPWVLGGGRVFSVIGWLDVHYPCEGWHRLQIRVGLPAKYARPESMYNLVPQVKAALEIPPNESYHVSLTGLSRDKQFSMEDPQSGWVSFNGGGDENDSDLVP